MLREYTCIICPNGCDIRAQIGERGKTEADGFVLWRAPLAQRGGRM